MGLVGNLPYCTHRQNTGKEDTIQEAIECAIENFMNKKRCRLTSASRTDRGVHAMMNCFTLPLMDFQMPTEKVKRLINNHLVRKSHDITVNEVLLVPAAFHPRAHAISREYIYRIAVAKEPRVSNLHAANTQTSDLFHLLPVTEAYRVLPLNSLNMDKALELIDLFRGEHDFSAFSKRGEQEADTVRKLQISMAPGQSFAIDPNQEYPYEIYNIHLKCRSFLHNMVRRIVGAIVSYASHDNENYDTIKNLLYRPNTRADPRYLCAEPWGLFLSRINYDKSAFVNSMKTHENQNTFKLGETASDDQVEKITSDK